MRRRATLGIILGYGVLTAILAAGGLWGAVLSLGRANADRDAFVPTAFAPYRDPEWQQHPRASTAVAPSPTPDPANVLPVSDAVAAKIVAGARAQVGDAYVPGYVVIGYPSGDVPKGQGVCTDVVVRAFRAAGYDLQRLVHQDMAGHFSAYPKNWDLRRPDPNIDHRRVPNLRRFFERNGRALPAVRDAARIRTVWRPGDVVTWKLPNGLDHTGILSDRVGASGIPLVIHNIGVCAEEDCLLAWPITGHYRYPCR